MSKVVDWINGISEAVVEAVGINAVPVITDGAIAATALIHIDALSCVKSAVVSLLATTVVTTRCVIAIVFTASIVHSTFINIFAVGSVQRFASVRFTPAMKSLVRVAAEHIITGASVWVLSKSVALSAHTVEAVKLCGDTPVVTDIWAVDTG